MAKKYILVRLESRSSEVIVDKTRPMTLAGMRRSRMYRERKAETKLPERPVCLRHIDGSMFGNDEWFDGKVWAFIRGR